MHDPLGREGCVGCAGFCGTVTVRTLLGNDRFEEQVPASAVACKHRVHDKWLTQARVDNSDVVYWVVVSRTCSGQAEGDSVSCDACAGVGALRSYRDVVRRAVFECSSSASRRRAGASRRLTHKALQRRYKRTWEQKVELLQRRTRREIVTERALRMDLRGVAAVLVEVQAAMVTQEFGDDEQTAIAIARDVMLNVTRQPRGRRHCEKARALAAVFRAGSGEATYNCISRALLLSHESAARQYLRNRDGLPYCASTSPDDIAFVVKFLMACMAVLGLPPGSVAFLLGEDETAVNQAVEVDLASDLVLGTCGCLCARCCTHIKICRARGCPDPHACDPSGCYAWKMGDDFEAFDRKVRNSRLSTMARAVLINPLHVGLPTVCLLWCGTCLTFNARDYILKQWRELEGKVRGAPSHAAAPTVSIESVLGPCIGQSSDGASTRRLAMMWRSRPNTRGFHLRGLQAYVFSGSDPNMSGSGRSMLSMDMDFIHNIKKLINSFHSAARTLQLGPAFVATMEHLRGIITNVDVALHGARLTDLNRKGYRAMRFESALRLITAQFLGALDQAIAGTLGGREADSSLKGVRVFLGVINRYAEIFLSRGLALDKRVESAGYVNGFLLLWRGWCREFEKEHNARVNASYVEPAVAALLATQKEELKAARKEARETQSVEAKDKVQEAKKAYEETRGAFERCKDPGETFVTEEAMKDVVLSCHFVVHLLQWFRENAPTLAIPFWRLGTDCLEDLFSLLGSFVMNKRTYTIREGLQTLRSKLDALLVAMINKVPTAKRARRAKKDWIEDETRSGDQLAYLSDVQLAQSWNKGLHEARADLTELKMAPVRQGRRGLPRWWTNPETQVQMPADDAGGDNYNRSEEDIMRADDVDDDGADGSDGDEVREDADDSDDDGGDGGEGGGGDGSGCVEEEKGEGVRAEDIDDATVVLDALDNLSRAATKMNVPNVGMLHKQAVCARYYNSGLEKIASDIGTRYANLDGPVFDVRESAWTIGPSSDVAVKFVSGFHIGRIVRIRRRYTRGWEVWTRPFDLIEAKTAKWALHIVCAWYKQSKTVVDSYTFGDEEDPIELGLATVICPVELIYDADNSLYRIPAAQQAVIDESMSGSTELDGE